MTTLHQALQQTSWRLLKIIGRERGLQFKSNIHKADLINRLHPRLLDPHPLARALTALTDLDRRALADIQTTGGRQALRHLRPRYGDLPRRSAALIQRLQTAQPDPPLSPLERLLKNGLIFFDPARADLYIPFDLLARLPQPDTLNPDAPPPETPPAAPHPLDFLAHDLTCLLALLHRHDVRPLKQRWLPPRFLLDWGRHSAVPPQTARPGSELQTGRRRLIHYLAHNAGWLALAGPVLKPTPAGWRWLQAPRSNRLQALRQSWAAPTPHLWRIFRLPGHTWLSDPAPLLNALHHWPPRLDPLAPEHLARAVLSRQPNLLDLLPANLYDPPTTLIETLVDLIAGPLTWMAGGHPEQNRSDEINNSVERRASAFTIHNSQFTAIAPLSPAKYTLTPTLHPDPLQSALTLTPETGLPEPQDLAVVVEVSQTFEVSKTSKVSIITASSSILALHRGWTPTALIDALDRLTRQPLDGPTLALLRAWANLAEQTTLRPAMLLETRDPGVITRLASTRRGRQLIHRTHTPRLVEIDPAKTEQLLKRLTRQEGVPPQQIGRRDRDRDREKSSLPLSLSPSDLWLAAQVYQQLGQHLHLPARLPQTLFDHLAETLSDTDLAAANAAAEQTMAALQRLIDGYAAFPVWLEDALPESESLPVIEQALAQGHNLHLDYYSAGSNTRAHREIEPHRLEWRGDTPYLVGFCHHAQAERVFRLDRIYAVVKVPQDEV